MPTETKLFQLTLTQKEAELLTFAWAIPVAAMVAPELAPMAGRSMGRRIETPEGKAASYTLTDKIDKIAGELEELGVK